MPSNFTISQKTINDFQRERGHIPHGNRERLFSLLLRGREIRHLSAKNTHFWQSDQKNLNRRFDRIYSEALEALAKTSIERNKDSLAGRLTPVTPLTKMAQKGAGLALAGLSGVIGGRLTYIFWSVPMTNLILHEHGHAWAMQLVYNNSEPQVSTNAQFWLDKGDYRSWLRGRRSGGPGNWTRLLPKDPHQAITLTNFGQSLTPLERSLFIYGAGLGVELLANTIVAGLGIAALKKKRSLGAFLLGSAFISHSAAQSYIRRYDTTSQEVFLKHFADPQVISVNLSALTGCSIMEAFQALKVGYAFFPVALLGALFLLMMNLPPDIPEECTLLKMLAQSQPDSKEHLELAKILTEIELEFDSARKDLEKSATGRVLERKQKLLTGKIFARLLSEVHHNKTTHKLFTKTERAMQKELKGALKATLPTTYYLRVIAGFAAMAAYALLSISKEILPYLAKAFYWLSGIFLVAQGVCVILDLIQMVSDVRNEKFSNYAKALSVLRTLVTLTSTALICVALFVPGLNTIFFPVLIVSTLLSLTLAFLQHQEMKRLRHFYQAIAEGPQWNQQLKQTRLVLEEVRAAASVDEYLKREPRESSEEYRLRMQEFQLCLEWLQCQESALEKKHFSLHQRTLVAESLKIFKTHLNYSPLLTARLLWARHISSRLPSLCDATAFSFTAAPKRGLS